MKSFKVLLFFVASSLLALTPGHTARIKRQGFPPQGGFGSPDDSVQGFLPAGFNPQQRPVFGTQGDSNFGPQRPPVGFRPQSRPPPDGFGLPRPPSGFGPQGSFSQPGSFGPQGPPFGPQQDFQDFGPDGPQFLRPRPPPNNPYTLPGANLNPLGGISEALESIARYDDKRCVARMLCEMAAGGSPGSGYRGPSGFFDLSGLRGIADILGAMTNSEGASPMFMFGSAALLGASQRDPYRCYRSYPECPRDPDRLVDYLNNHNGGFFKLFNPTPAPQDVPTTRKPPYFRRGKKVRKQKYRPDVANGYDENQPLSPSKDVPISGKPPILAETDDADVTARPPREIYTNPTRPNKGNKRPLVFSDQSSSTNNNFFNDRPNSNRIIFDNLQNSNKQNYETNTPKPNLFINQDSYNTPKPTYNYDLYAPNRPTNGKPINFNRNTTPRPLNDQYYTSRPLFNNNYQSTTSIFSNIQRYATPRPNRGFAFQQSNHEADEPEYYDDDSSQSVTTRPVLYITPLPSYGQPGNAYTNPNRVLWARPSKISRNFDISNRREKQFKFPEVEARTNNNNKNVVSHAASTTILSFPTDRTGTGELRLDTEQLEQSSSQYSHQQRLAESSREGKSLQFPEENIQPSSRTPLDASFTFPHQ